MSSSVRTLPIVTIQVTFPTVVSEVYNAVIPAENIWISCYDHSPRESASSSSLHGKVRVVLDEEDREKVVMRTIEGDVSLTEAECHETSYVYDVSSPSMRIPPTKLLFPVQEYADPERSNPQKPHRITAFALSPDKSQYSTGYLDGQVFIYPVIPIAPSTSPSKYPTCEMYSPPNSTYNARRQILTSATNSGSTLTRAHKSIVTSLQFFPSSRVLLSAGADFSLQIYPANPIPASVVSSTPTQSSERVPSVRTLTAHTRSVTSTAMIGRGRAIISASLDGTFRIWDVSTGKEETLVHSASGIGFGINRIFLDADSSSTDGDPTTKGTLYAALHDGLFQVFKLDGSQKPPTLTPSFHSERVAPGALNVITVSSSTDATDEKYVAVGSANGTVSVYNASFDASVHFRRSDASIEDLGFISLPGDGSRRRLGLVIATADGLPWIAALDEPPCTKEDVRAKVSVYAELAGGDVDAIRAVAIHTSPSLEAEVWTAGDDGIVRRYMI